MDKQLAIKILVDAHVFDDGFQGTTTYLKGLYSALVEDNNFEITLAAHNINQLKTIFVHPAFRFIELSSKSKYKRLAFDIPGLIKTNGYHFAHFQYITPPVKTCMYVNTIHDLLFLDFPEYFPWTYRFSKKHIFKFSAGRADVICTVSEYSKQALVKHFKVSPDKITITPNAVDAYNGSFIDIKSQYNLDKFILFVSRMEPRKNHLLLLRAFVELELYKQGYKLVFIGRTNDVPVLDFQEYYRSLPVEILSEVILIENISYQELNSFYHKADLFVYPSVAEGFGIPPLEAAVLDCKVLCSKTTAMADFSFFGDYLFDPENLVELKLKMIKILADKSYPYADIKNAVLQKYNWRKIAGSFAQTLKSKIQQKNTSGV